MKQIIFKKKFQKQLQKLPPRSQQAFKQRLQDFLDDPYQPHLRYHSLKGDFLGLASINISGDIRAIFREEGEILIIFLLIGTHSDLY